MGDESIDVGSTLNNIGIVFYHIGDYEKALENYNKCLEIQTRVLGSESIQVATTLNNIGSVYKNKSLEIQTKVLGPESIRTKETKLLKKFL